MLSVIRSTPSILCIEKIFDSEGKFIDIIFIYDIQVYELAVDCCHRLPSRVPIRISIRS